MASRSDYTFERAECDHEIERLKRILRDTMVGVEEKAIAQDRLEFYLSVRERLGN